MKSKPEIAVIGSSNVDLVMKMPRLPERGETITGAQFLQTFGGKGANQAVACARAGATTLFINAVGEDPYVETMLENFERDGIDCSWIARVQDCSSGHALCMIGEGGSNYLSVASGANERLTPEWLERCAEALRAIPIWLLQNEIPNASNTFLLNTVRTDVNRVIWNYAPFVQANGLPLAACHVLIVNEIEASQLSGVAVLDRASAESAGEALCSKGVANVIVTLGAAGCVYVGADGCLFQPVFDVEAVDTVAAGDTFCGALACGLGEGMKWEAAMRFATAAASLAVTRLGAQPSIPKREEIDGFLRQHLTDQ